VVADDHRLLPEAVRALLEPDADIEIAGVAYEAERILTVVGEAKPDLLLLDPHMPRMDGLALLDNLRASHPEVAVMLLSESLDPELKAAALARGAKGVIVKGSDPAALAPALRAAVRISDAEIARELSISRPTVKVRLRRAHERLDARLEALRVLVDRAIFGNDYDWLK
jgi:DNA-binding NarL/FixJ family response regulator